MKENVLIAGYGKMGKNYARNFSDYFSQYNIVIADASKDQCEQAMADYPNASVYWIANTQCSSIQQANSIAEIVTQEEVSGIVNATQTDSHIEVVESALSVKAPNGSSVVKRILQEKPFGLFDGDVKFDSVCDTLTTSNIRFSLNSILMFSDIWDVADEYLAQQKRVHIIASECIYGKNRTNDTRPAHEGVFGTEGTHAIDILRGRGLLTQDIVFGKSQLLRGDISVDKDVIYECVVSNVAVEVSNHSIQMSLRYDENHRHVTHVIDCGMSKQIFLKLDFDKAGHDIMTVSKMDGEILLQQDCPSGTKLKNSISAVFDDKSHFKCYDLQETLRLRQMIASLKGNSTIVQGDSEISLIKPRPRLIRPTQ